ncbi:MAG: 30S ribosomal protein S6 [Rhodospirillales bacterium]|nr:30S ribosomal protein S6 [Rhodospirillales bacterium]
MPYYETVFIARQDLSSAQVEAMTEQFCQIIKDGGGKIHKTENWGLRTLAYKINKNRKGHYVLIESDTPAPAVLEMERLMRLNEDVMRYMTIREDALSEGPSIVMDKGGRDRDDNNNDEKEAA